MKRVFSLFLCMAMMLGLSACQSSGSTSGTKTSTISNNDVLKPFDTSGTIDETVLVDEQGVKITATSLDYDNYAASIHLKIENNSAMTIDVLCNSNGWPYNSVNGYMTTDGYLWKNDIAPQSTLEDDVEFSYSELELFGIREIADITLGLRVENSDSYDYIYSGIANLETSLKKDHDYTLDYYQSAINNKTIQNEYGYSMIEFKDDTIFDASDISIVSEAIIKNKDEETSIFFEAINNSENNVMLELDDIYLNDILLSSYTYSYEPALAGKTAIFNIDLSGLLEYTDEDVSDIGQIKKMKFTISLVDDTTGSTLYSDELSLDLPNLTVSYDKDE